MPIDSIVLSKPAFFGCVFIPMRKCWQRWNYHTHITCIYQRGTACVLLCGFRFGDVVVKGKSVIKTHKHNITNYRVIFVEFEFFRTILRAVRPSDFGIRIQTRFQFQKFDDLY